mgnify:CR=1 FL=1
MGRSGGGGGGFSGGGGFGGGGFGGGFSSGGGFGGGFSGGGRSGGGGHSGGGSFGGSNNGFGGRPFFGGLWGPVIISNTTRNYGGGNGPSNNNGGGNNGNNGSNRGCGTALAIFIVIMVFLVIVAPLLSSGGSSGGVSKSTVAREPLAAGAVQETDYYTDEPGWISSKSTLLSGMKEFYEKTGVQPYLYIANSVDGTTTPTTSQLTAYAKQLYSEKFTDQGHFLLVFCDDGKGSFNAGYWMGDQARAVLDDEALDIFAGYMKKYYPSDMKEDEFFSTTYAKTAERIMTVTKSEWPLATTVIVVVVAIVVIVSLLYTWWKKSKEQKNVEAKRTADILNTPLEKFGDSEVEDLAKKYENKTADGKDLDPWDPKFGKK